MFIHHVLLASQVTQNLNSMMETCFIYIYSRLESSVVYAIVEEELAIFNEL